MKIFEKYKGPVTYGWRFWRLSIKWQPYCDTPNNTGKLWCPFILDYWKATIAWRGYGIIWSWKRYANRYGYANC